MHHIYETNAFVLKNSPQGEADGFITLFTKDLGLIRATAQGIRYEKSKLRFAMQNFCYSHVSIVRGKGIWRLTNANAIENFYSNFNNDTKNVVARIFRLLERLLAGESGDEKLFEILYSGLKFLEQRSKEENLDKEKVLDIEAIIVLRLLNRLGYVGASEKINFFVLNNEWEGEVFEKMKNERREALAAINAGLRESQL